ncbi:MAG: thioether cross-link-forming SCIFF peptide maturase [Clostridia bacterium]|nr:thioether cross-link-forming SCIFF peptide maturase [Clostridia bacterium]
MVHAFKFAYHDKVYHFVWDNESGSLHNVDYVAFLYAKKRYGQALDEKEDKDFSAIAQADLQELKEEFNELEKMGVLNTPCTSFAKKKRIGEIKALCLHICNDCNLRCKYCFADEGTYHTTERAYMSEEVGKKAIDFLIAHSGKRNNLEVDFFGGEPLMNLDVVKAIVEYARSREKESEKSFNFTMTTNCVLLNDKNIEWLNKEMFNVVLSIDGRHDVHSAVRKAVNGKDCYDLIANNAIKFAKARGDKSYYVRGTFTAQNLDFADDVLTLNDMGFDQISIEPVVTDIADLKITKEHLPAILKEYERLAENYIDRRKTDKWFNFFHFMIDLEGGPCIVKRLTGCGSGCEYLAITPTGGIYPCHQFAENKDYYMGNVFDGDLDLSISDKFADNIVTNKPDCKDCMAKYYCSGGCVANNLNYAGDMGKPYDISCEMMRKRLELSLAINAIEGAEEQ